MEGFAEFALYYKVDENFNTLYDANGNPIINEKAQFNDAAMLVLGIADAENKMHYYGLPETQSFPMMFIRTDILAQLGIDTLDTWDDLMAAATTLSENNMTIGLNNDYKIFLYQQGSQLFADDGMRINLDSNLALDSFETMCNMFTQYSFPYKYDFVNRFRTGEMPILLGDYTGLYNQLKVFATEITGKWEFMPLPGEINGYDEDGKPIINNVSISGVSATVMVKGCDKVESSWEFMKWWVSAESQVRFGREIESILGSSARYTTANTDALEQLAWSAPQLKVLREQQSWTVGFPEIAGGYSTTRHMTNAIRKVINTKEDARETLLTYARTINDEIRIKRQEFGLAVD
mgnify:CR=1 FL=1